MEVIYATLIICIFAAWVWDLKHQVSHLKNLALPNDVEGREAGSLSHRRHHPSHVRADRVPKLAEEPAHFGRPIRKDDGVATWVID